MSSATKAYTYINNHGQSSANMIVEEVLAGLFDLDQGLPEANLTIKKADGSVVTIRLTHEQATTH